MKHPSDFYSLQQWSPSLHMLTALTPLIQWWVSYEQWILDKFGPAYRDQCHADWKKAKSKKPWLPPALATEWLTEFLAKSEQHTRPKHFAQAS